MHHRAKVNRRLVVAPLGEPGDRHAHRYPDLGLMVELRRVEDLGDAIVPAWLVAALAADQGLERIGSTPVAGEPQRKREAGKPTSPSILRNGLVARARSVGDFHATVLHFANTIGGLHAQLARIFAERLGGHHAIGDRVADI